MKIEQMNPLGKLIQSENRKSQQAGDLDFQKLLGQAGDRLKAECPGTAPAAPPGASGATPLLSEKTELGVRRAQAVVALEAVISLLESYQGKLADPGNSLRRIEPSVLALANGAEKLDLLKEKLPQNDPLREIIKTAGIVSGVEIARFNRGDYL